MQSMLAAKDLEGGINSHTYEFQKKKKTHTHDNVKRHVFLKNKQGGPI